MSADFIFDTLTESWLKVSVVLALGLLVTLLYRNTSPEWRHNFWIVLFGIVLIAPLILLTSPRLGLLPSPVSALTTPPQNEEINDFVTFTPTHFETIHPAKGQAGSEDGFSFIAFSWKKTAILIWALGFSIYFLRLLAGLVHLRQLKKSGTPPPSFMQVMLNRPCLERDLKKPVRLLISPRVKSPFAWNFGSPTIALPVDAKEWTGEELEMVFRHELVHIERHDSLSSLLTGMVKAFHWFNPLAWRAAKRVSELREQICDRRVVGAGCDPGKYATLLFHQAHAKSAPFPFSATAMAKPGTLEKRVNMILKNKKLMNLNKTTPETRSQQILSLMGAAGLLIVPAVIILLGFAPQSVIAEEKDKTELTLSTSEGGIVYELNDTPIEWKALGSALESGAKKNPPLAFMAESRIAMEDVLRTIEKAREAGFTEFTFQKAGVDSGEASSIEQATPLQSPVDIDRITVVPKEKIQQARARQISVTSRFVEEPSPLLKKLNSLILPSIELVDVPIEDVVDYLIQMSIEFDTATPDPSVRGINIVLKGSPESKSQPINLKMKGVSIAQAIKLAAQQALMQVSVDEHVVMLRHTGNRNTSTHPLLGKNPELEKRIGEKLETIMIPSIQFSETSLRDALQFLAQRSVELDTKSPNPDERGTNIVAENGSGELDQPITLRLKNIPLETAIRYSAELADMKHRIEGNAVVIYRPANLEGYDSGYGGEGSGSEYSDFGGGGADSGDGFDFEEKGNSASR